MIKSGLCSVTFRNKTPSEIIDLVSRAGLCAIEWGSDAHIREGDIKTAGEVRAETYAAGLEIPSYGSYYRLGNRQDFKPYIDSAIALGAKEIRIWAGINPSAYHLFEERQAIVCEAKEISRVAAEYGVTISTECHAYTLTDTPESLLLFMNEVNEPNFKTYWQALLHIPEEEQIRSLRAVYASGKLTNIHVQHFHLFDAQREQRPLSDAYVQWDSRFEVFKNDETVRYAFLEFVKDGSEANLLSDAQTLKNILDEK